MASKLRVGVLFGGQSGEHEVSLASARSVIDTLEASGKYEVLPIGIRSSGAWIAGSDAHALLSAEAKFLLPGAGKPAPASAAGSERRSALLPDGGGAPLLRLDAAGAHPERVDVVFPVLHGPRGEDGTIQGFLELAGVPYVGCGVAASALGMDKDLTKTLLRAAGLPVADWALILENAWKSDRAQTEARARAIGFPCFIKPANMGSSVGISKARDAAQLVAGIEEALRFDLRVIVERGLDAREIECSVLGNHQPDASVPGEVVPCGEFYDYRAKYLAQQASELIIPAPLNPSQTREVREMAVRAFRALDGAGMARVDFLLERSSGRFFVNELNTIPGFTSISMYAKLWEASGLSYPALLDRLIALALERHRERKQLQVGYTPEG